MLTPQQREVVYQVVREALTNVRRHSGSSICRVRMAFSARPFLIEIEDEGRGLQAARGGGYGLVGMRERAAGIGGRLEVVSTGRPRHHGLPFRTELGPAYQVTGEAHGDAWVARQGTAPCSRW